MKQSVYTTVQLSDSFYENWHIRVGNLDSVLYFSFSNRPPIKHENVNGDIFNNAVYGKLKGDPDRKLKYIKSLYEETGQVKFDLEYFEKMTNMYIRSGLDKAELEEITSVIRYTTDELGNLRKALTEAIGSESKIVVDPDDHGVEQTSL